MKKSRFSEAQMLRGHFSLVFATSMTNSLEVRSQSEPNGR